jgi:hypothetical protein
MKEKPKIGQILYSLNVGNSARHRTQELTEVKVVKVGRKYFTCEDVNDGYFKTTYHIENWKQKTQYTANSELYESPQEWENKKESAKLIKYIHNSFEWGVHNKRKLSLDQLRRIVKIMGENNVNQSK